ncbi:MAG TPA: hypothetical protein VJ044_17200, partial [Candidatus Hodarchaeales archaeon]|nr:hypothetical protein [Candidatus Hodarchaeales archaeon]
LFVSFSPSKTPLRLKPTDVACIPIKVIAPKDKGKIEVQVLFSPENAWGEYSENIELEVV